MEKITEEDKEVLKFLKRQFPKMNLKKTSMELKKKMIKAFYDTEKELRKQSRGWN